MRDFMFRAVVILFSSLLWLSLAAASSIDDNIKDLKDQKSEVRANAAYELGCG